MDRKAKAVAVDGEVDDGGARVRDGKAAGSEVVRSVGQNFGCCSAAFGAVMVLGQGPSAGVAAVGLAGRPLSRWGSRSGAPLPFVDSTLSARARNNVAQQGPKLWSSQYN